jgi:hypothetical protein
MKQCNKRKRLLTMTMRKLALSCLASTLVLSAALPVHAAETPTDNDWHFGASLYFWGAGIGGETTNGGDIDIGFNDILENLDMTYMGTFEARQGKWLLMTDVIYMDVSAGNHGDIKTPLGDIAKSSSIEQANWIITPVVGYNLIDDSKWSLDVVGGARYLSMDVTVKLKATGPLNTTRKYETSDSGDVLDAIVGVRGRVNLAQNWYLPYYADIGGGDSDWTRQIFAGVGYQFNQLSVNAGYRYLEWSFKDSDVLDNQNISGPLIGMRYQF